MLLFAHAGIALGAAVVTSGIAQSMKPREKRPIVDGSADKPIPDVYKALDTDLARDNLENDLPNADLQDL